MKIFERMPKTDTRIFWVLFGIVLIAGIMVHVSLWPMKAIRQDIQYIWRDSHSLFLGENPYARIVGGPVRDNGKYSTYFPMFYTLGALAQTFGLRNYNNWTAFWKLIFLMCNLGITTVIFTSLYRRGMVALAFLAAIFWLFNVWTISVSLELQIDFIPILLLLLSLALFDKHRNVSLLLLSASLAVKQLAIFLVPLYLIWVWQSSCTYKKVFVSSLIIISIPALTSLPFIVWNPEGFMKSILFSTTRGSANQFKLLPLEQIVQQIVPNFVGVSARLPMLFLMLLTYISALHRKIGMYLSVLLIMSIFADFNSVIFRQYMIWILPFAPLAACDFLYERQLTTKSLRL